MKALPLAIIVTIAVLTLPIAPYAQGRPDFTGTWTLDPAKSDPLGQGRGGPGGTPTLTIKQIGDDMLIVTEGRQGQQLLTYKLDGSESMNQLPGRGGTSPVRSKAKWDGTSLVIESTREQQGAPIMTKEVRKLDTAGKIMQIETTIQTPQGEQKRTAVYMRDGQFADPCKVNPNLPICGKK